MSLLDRLRQTSHDKVVVLGLSGVPAHVIRDEPLPTLSTLLDAGTTTRSVLPPDEHAIWPAVTAGRNPGHTGVFGLVDRDVGTYDTYVPHGSDVQVPRLWDLLEAAGHSTTVLNVPVTNPPQKEVGQMIAGPLAPDEARGGHPEAVREYLETSDYRIDVDAELGPAGALEDLQADARATLDARFDAFERFVTDGDWSLFMGCVTAIDRASHFLYRDYVTDGANASALTSLYERLDDRIATFLELVPDDAMVCLVGDHGFAPLEQELHCNRWLADIDWLDYRTDAADSLADIGEDTRAYALPQGRFYLNLEGREPRGSVPESEYDTVRDSLRNALETLTDPAGDPVIDTVYTRAELYDGPHLDMAPDLLAVPEHGYDLVANFTGSGPLFSDTPRTGMHTTTEVPLAIDDPAVDLTDATPFDLAPTVLDRLDVARPDGLSGRSRYEPE